MNPHWHHVKQKREFFYWLITAYLIIQILNLVSDILPPHNLEPHCFWPSYLSQHWYSALNWTRSLLSPKDTMATHITIFIHALGSLPQKHFIHACFLQGIPNFLPVTSNHILCWSPLWHENLISLYQFRGYTPN